MNIGTDENICKNEYKEYRNCTLCPRGCGADRSIKTGVCNSTDKCRIVRAALHYWEEPCISGKNGSGTIFFAGCTLGCVFCQNYEISDGKSLYGVEVDVDRLVEIFFELEAKGANNINFVTPTHYMPHIRDAIKRAKEKGFKLPFIYNTSGYERTESLRELDGLIDVYLPDMKYFDKELAARYSKAPDYVECVMSAIEEMVRQTGATGFDENGIIQRGVIVRHMILPAHTKDSKNVIKYLYDTYGDDIYISIMNQYTPVQTDRMKNYPELGRTITAREYDKVIDYAVELGVTNAYIQEGETCKESFIPDFDGEGCLKDKTK